MGENFTKFNEENFETPILFKTEYDYVIKNLAEVFKRYGESGIIMFTEDSALVSFDKSENIRLQMKKEKYFKRSDFENFEKFKIIGKDPEPKNSPIRLFLGDIKNNLVKIIIFILLLLFFANPYSKNLNIIEILNEKLIDIIGFLIGMIFIFIGFVYSDKERSVEVYKHGLSYNEFKIDCYIINLSILSLVFVCISLMIGNISSVSIPKFVYNFNFLSLFLNSDTRFWLCFSLTGIAITILIVEFDSLINYYIKSSRNKFFIDAFESSIQERKNDKK